MRWRSERVFVTYGTPNVSDRQAQQRNVPAQQKFISHMRQVQGGAGPKAGPSTAGVEAEGPSPLGPTIPRGVWWLQGPHSRGEGAP